MSIKSYKELLVALKKLDWRAVKLALEEHPNLRNYRGAKGENLLHVCCGIEIEKRGLSSTDSIKMAGVLLDASFDINREAFTEGDWKATPLWCAIGRGENLELAKYLLKRGADPELASGPQRSTIVRLPSSCSFRLGLLWTRRVETLRLCSRSSGATSKRPGHCSKPARM